MATMNALFHKLVNVHNKICLTAGIVKKKSAMAHMEEETGVMIIRNMERIAKGIIEAEEVIDLIRKSIKNKMDLDQEFNNRDAENEKD